jgi:hypothetical protein
MTQCVPADRFGALHLYDTGSRRFLVLSPIWCHELMARNFNYDAPRGSRFVVGVHDRLSLITGGLAGEGFHAHLATILVPHPANRRQFDDRWLRRQLPTTGDCLDGFFMPVSWLSDPEKWEEREIM